MAFTARTRAAIAAEYLAFLSAEYAAASTPRVLLTAPGSDADLFGQVFAVELEGIEAAASQVSSDLLPDTASETALERFGSVYNVPRRTGTPAALTVSVTSGVAGTYAIPTGTQMASGDGTLYDVTSTEATTSGGTPTAIINVVAADAGASTTREVGDTLTFTVSPSGLDPTGEVASVTTPGADAEDNASLAERIIARLRERPGSGSRSDWAAWIESFTGYDIEDVFIYAQMAPDGTFPLLGCVSAVALGPAQGDSVANTRIITGVPGAALSLISLYIEGLANERGVAIPDGTQLRPVTMGVNDYSILSADVLPQAIVATLVVADGSDFEFTATPTIVSATATSITVAGDYSLSGTSISGMGALVNLGTGAYRGGYYRVLLGVGVWGGVNTVFPVATMPGTPSGTMYPAPSASVWLAARTAVFDFFDRLAPGDTSPEASRWPAESASVRSVLYPTAVGGAIVAVDDVLSCTVTTPAGPISPPIRTIVTLSTFLVRP